MARFLFPADRDQLAYIPPGAVAGAFGSYPGLRVTIYLTSTLSTVATTITDTSGASLGGIVTVTAQSLIPDFLGPDGVDTLYVSTAAGVRALTPRAPAAASRAATAATVVSQVAVTGETYPRLRWTADGGLIISDGATNPTTLTGVLHDITGRPDEITVRVRAGNDNSVHSIMEWLDKGTAPAMWIGNTGGLGVNDEMYTTRSVYGPDGVRGDIYGFFKQLGNARFCHAGPPGNMADYDTATAEAFNGFRNASLGDWGTILGATASASITNPYGGTVDPGESFHVRRHTQSSGTTLELFSPAAGSDGFPVTPGQKIRMFTFVRSATTGRVFTPTIQFYDSANNYQAVDIVGANVTTTTTGWSVLTVGGTVPAGINKAQYKLMGANVPVNENHYEVGFGCWVDTRTTGGADPNPNSVWSPPLIVWPGSGVFTGMRTNDRYGRTDVTGPGPASPGGTAGTNYREFVLDGTVGTVYAPSAIGAPGSTATPRWVGIA